MYYSIFTLIKIDLEILSLDFKLYNLIQKIKSNCLDNLCKVRDEANLHYCEDLC